MHVLACGGLEEAWGALPEGASGSLPELARALEDPKRTVRAKALAAGAEEILRAVQESALR